MEIIKQNETFNLKDSNETFDISGSIVCEVSGSLNIHFTVNKVEGEYVGNVSYNKQDEASNVNFNINCPEAYRDDLSTYSDSVIKAILENFK